MVEDHERCVVELDELDQFIDLPRTDEQLPVGKFPVLCHDSTDLRTGSPSQGGKFFNPGVEVDLVIREVDGDKDGSLPGHLQMFTMLLIH